MKRPTVLYPTLVRGLIKAKEIRCESLDGSEMWLPNLYPEDVKEFKNVAPFEKNGKTWFISHLQKKATFFTLLYDPFIFHYGNFWKLQEQTSEGHWIPGTEKGIYTRTCGWRWNVPDDNSQGTPWIWSWGYFGMHLD